jgi:hypothetical protein
MIENRLLGDEITESKILEWFLEISDSGDLQLYFMYKDSRHSVLFIPQDNPMIFRYKGLSENTGLLLNAEKQIIDTDEGKKDGR